MHHLAVVAVVPGSGAGRWSVGYAGGSGVVRFGLTESAEGAAPAHSRFTRGTALGTRSTMAQTGVSGPVVVDGYSFLDALFACACRG
eukprot:scaffold15685_cov41-Phaeocystis_antarctica.AAC.4